MSIIGIIPKKEEISKTLELAAKYNAAFEYNDFFVPDVLDDPARIDSLISFYLRQPHDRSSDTLHGAFLDVTIHSSDSLIRQIADRRIHQSMEIAHALGIRGVVFHTNLIANFCDREYQQNWLKINRDYFTALAAEYPDIEIYMENMFDLEPDLFVAFGEATKECPTLHLCLDVAHAHLSNKPIGQWLNPSARYIRHIHINDNDGVSDLHQPVGQGTVDWQSFNRIVRQCQTPPSVLVENNSIEDQQQSIAFLETNHIYPFQE